MTKKNQKVKSNSPPKQEKKGGMLRHHRSALMRKSLPKQYKILYAGMGRRVFKMLISGELGDI